MDEKKPHTPGPTHEAVEVIMIGSYANDAAHRVLVNHTNMEGGCPRIDWYKLRNEIASALELAISDFRNAPASDREPSAKLIDDMLKEPGWANHPRSRLALTVAARTVRRGRALSSHEKWENIKAFCEAHGDD